MKNDPGGQNLPALIRYPEPVTEFYRIAQLQVWADSQFVMVFTFW